MKLLKAGKKAPNFKLTDKDGSVFELNKIKADQFIIYFYPKDDTPGCTLQAKEFTKALKNFKKLGIEVFGISGGDDKTKTKFCKKHKLSVTLLSDPDFTISKKFGVFGEKKFMGRKYMGINRVTYLLDKKQKVSHVFEKVTPEGHAKEILKFIKES